jgi:S-DNA-T family DNA segregation ATPase FtsK/SpoIIIE
VEWNRSVRASFPSFSSLFFEWYLGKDLEVWILSRFGAQGRFGFLGVLLATVCFLIFPTLKKSEEFSPRPRLKRSKSLSKYHLPPSQLWKPLASAPWRVRVRTVEDIQKILKEFSFPTEGLRQEEKHSNSLFFVLPVTLEQGKRFLAYTEALSQQLPGLRIFFPLAQESHSLGLEVPQESWTPFSYEEVVSESALTQKIPWVLGVQSSGEAVILDLAQPLLLTGAPGMGQIQFIQSIFTTLWRHQSPLQTRVLLCDLAQNLEISPKEPHFLGPIFQNPHQVVQIFQRLCDYRKKRVEVASVVPETWIIVVNGFEAVQEITPYLETLLQKPLEEGAGLTLVPLLVAYQASPQVIPAILKECYPTRICLKVSSALDSRYLLERNGAEHLKGIGDFYLLKKAKEDLIRGQCFESTPEEFQKLQEFWLQQGEALWRPEWVYLFSQEELKTDPYLEKAIRLVLTTQRISVTLLKNRLQIEEDRAQALLVRMEEQKIIIKEGSHYSLLMSLTDWEESRV